MAALNLKIDETDPDVKEVAGRYSDWNAFCVLKRYLEPDGDLTMDQATKLLHEMLPSDEEKQKEKYTSQPDLFSCVFLDVAQQIPYHHPAQIRFVRLIKDLEVSDRVTMRASTEGYSYYVSMYDLKITMRERFPWEAGDGKYANMSAFIARTYAAGIIGGLSFAIWVMQDGLEKPVHDEYYSEFVSAAAMWIICSGQLLFDEFVQFPRETDESKEKSWAGGPLYTGPIIGLERWKFWQEAFTAAAESSVANNECKVNALKAANLMDVISRDCKW